MRTQVIERVVDARAGQQRVIYWLRCGHKLSVAANVVNLHPAHYLSAMQTGAMMNCSFCPDPTPVEVRESKSARQLWKEAGEP